jgi:hypothetical protein
MKVWSATGSRPAHGSSRSYAANIAAASSSKIPKIAPRLHAEKCSALERLAPAFARIEKGEIDPAFVITHRATLEEGPELYKTFRAKQDGCVKVVMKP